MYEGWGARGAFTQYDQNMGHPAPMGGNAIKFSKTVSEISDIWYGYVVNANRGDSVQITTWIRFEATIPKSSSAFGLGIRGQKPDNSFLSNIYSPETWYFITFSATVTSTGNITAGLTLDSVSEGQVLWIYDLRINNYPGSALIPLMVGSVKFSASLSNWQWCNPCGEQIGVFLDFTFNVKVRNNGTVSVDQSTTMANAGSQYAIYLSQYVQFNYGPETLMVKGYPKFKAEDNNNYFTIRWLKQPSNINTYSYDPIVNAIAYPPSPSTGGPSKSLKIILGVTIPVAVILYFIFFGFWWFSRKAKRANAETQPTNPQDEKKTTNDTGYQALPN